MVIEEAENVAEVVEKVAELTEKVSVEIANKLPEKSKLKEAAQVVENYSKEIAHDAHLTQDILHKVYIYTILIFRIPYTNVTNLFQRWLVHKVGFVLFFVFFFFDITRGFSRLNRRFSDVDTKIHTNGEFLFLRRNDPKTMQNKQNWKPTWC